MKESTKETLQVIGAFALTAVLSWVAGMILPWPVSDMDFL